MRRCARHARFWTAISSGRRPYGPTEFPAICPSCCCTIDEAGDLGIVKQLLRAREYWRLKRLAVDLVILNDHPATGAAELQAGARCRDPDRPGSRRRGGKPGRRQRLLVFAATRCPQPSRELLQTAARAIFAARSGGLSDQLARLPEPEAAPRRRLIRTEATPRSEAPRSLPALEFFNGFGGFAAAGREYITVLEAGQWTPAPWINVIANPHFGFLVSADGTGSTWSMNARENQLTPWSNDPISNSPAEVIYIRDEVSGDLWSADSAADSRAGLFVRRPAWLRLQPVRAQLARNSAGTPAIRAARGFLEDFAVENRQSLRRGAPAVDHPLRGVGAGKSAQPHGALHHHGSRSAELRPARAQPVEHGVSIAGGVHGHGRPAADVDGRPRRIHRPSRIAGRAGGPARPGSIVQPDRRRVGPLRRDAGEIHATARRGERVRARSGTGGIEGGGSRPARRAIAVSISMRC